MNEPVAFWNKDFDLWEENAIQTYKADGWNIPIYTHLVKELTDEEIWKTIIEGGFYDCVADWLSMPCEEDRAKLKALLLFTSNSP